MNSLNKKRIDDLENQLYAMEYDLESAICLLSRAYLQLTDKKLKEEIDFFFKSIKIEEEKNNE